MKNILVINTSVNRSSSISRKLVDYFVNGIVQNNYEYSIDYRDLAVELPPHISHDWITSDRRESSSRTAEEKILLLQSDEYINELIHSDIIVLACPMYNWSIPSHLKAYLDHVLRFNETFGIAAGAGNVRYKGLLKSKRLLLIMTRGSSDYQFGGRNSHMDFQSGYLKLIFSIMGIDNITEITVDGLNDVPQVRESNINKASNQLSEFIASHL